MATRVLIVDDHAGFRRAARSLLSAEGYDVVGEAAGGAAARDAVAALQPDLVLLDVQLPDADGVELAAELTGEAEIVLVSTREAADYGERLAASPARGFLTKAELSGPALAALLA